MVNGISTLNFHLNLTVFTSSFTGEWSVRGWWCNVRGMKEYKGNFHFHFRVISVDSHQKMDQLEDNEKKTLGLEADNLFLRPSNWIKLSEYKINCQQMHWATCNDNSKLNLWIQNEILNRVSMEQEKGINSFMNIQHKLPFPSYILPIHRFRIKRLLSQIHTPICIQRLLYPENSLSIIDIWQAGRSGKLQDIII